MTTTVLQTVERVMGLEKSGTSRRSRKMTKLTTETLKEIIGSYPEGSDEIECLMAQKLLAYEQAVDRPVGEIFRCSGNKTLRWWNDVPEGTVLYAAPVLPKQPDVTITDEGTKIIKAAEKLVRCKGRYHSEQNYRALAALFGVTVPDLPPLPSDEAPAQPVIPEQCEVSKKRLEVIGYGSVPASIDEQRSMARTLLSAQPVSEPYKLKDAVEDIRNSGVEIDADKIKAERDAINSPVIPDGWKLVPIEPTAEMAQAARDCHEGESFLPYSIYRAMLAAAPAQESE
jgi:predicted peroxiredoxin